MAVLGLLVRLMAATLPGIVSAENNIKYINRCPYDVYSHIFGLVESGWTGHDHEAVTIPANIVTYRGLVDGEKIGDGISLNLRDLPKHEVASAVSIQPEDNLILSRNHLWYDLSSIDYNPNADPRDSSSCQFIPSGMKMYADRTDEGCGADGQCHNIYKEHGFREGEPTFRCDDGKDIVIEFCNEHAGPKPSNGHVEPRHSISEPEKKPGDPTTNGVCGASGPDGATCFGYAYGNCCSQYGWCGFSKAHCGAGCQPGFGYCFGQPAAKPSSYQPPAESPSYNPPFKTSTFHSSYSKPTPSYHPPASSYSPPGSSYYPQPSSHHQPSTTHTPGYSHIEHTWSSYSTHTASYAKPSSLKSTPTYSEPTLNYEKPTSSYHASSSNYLPPAHETSYSFAYSPAPSHNKSTPVYSKPSSSCPTPSQSKSTPIYSRPTPMYSSHTPVYNKPTPSYATPTHIESTAYTPPAHTPSYSPPYSPPPYRTIYATHTITETRPHVTKTVTLSASNHYSSPHSSPAPHTPLEHHTPTEYYQPPTPPEYSAPTSSTAIHSTPSHSTPVYNQPSHTPQQEPHIPSSWYNKPSTLSAYSAPTTSPVYAAPTPAEHHAPTFSAYDEPPQKTEYDIPTYTEASHYPPAQRM